MTRNAWVAAGLPWSVPATSVDRHCGSSQQAAHFVAQGYRRRVDIAIACGVESMTRCRCRRTTRGRRAVLGRVPAHTDNTLGIQFWVAQVLADKWGVTRDEMDGYALQSHRGRGEHRQRLLPGRDRAGARARTRRRGAHGRDAGDDEGIRRNASLERSRACRRVGVRGATRPRHHGRQLFADDRRRGGDADRRRGLRRAPRPPGAARFRHFAVAAEDPVLVLSAPVPVTYKLMERTG